MKMFEVDVDINGTITFEVEAKNKNEAKAKVDDILSNTFVKEAIANYRNNLVINEKVKQDKDMER
jgi:phosphoribosylformylglycinamidine (FGAM) synthase PurS component